MGIITISLNDEKERLIRKLAMQKYGHRKGAIAQIIGEAATQYAESEQSVARRESKIAEIEIARMEKGFKIGYKQMKRAEMWGF